MSKSPVRRSSNNAATQPGYHQCMGTFVPLSASAVSSATTFRVPPPAAAACFRLPPLRCSFPSLLHPHHEVVREQCDAWILGVAQPPSPAATRLLLDCLLPRLLCLAIPTASSLPRLIHVTKMISWLMIGDDEDDLPDALGADVSATAASAALVMDILRNTHKLQDPHPNMRMRDGNASATRAHDDQYLMMDIAPKPSTGKSKAKALKALAQLWGEMHTSMPPKLSKRFVSTMVDYFDAVKVQAAHRKAHELPDIGAYVELRRHASFILPAFALVEYAIGIELDNKLYSHPQIQEFRTVAVDYICLCNDLISCRVEIGVGDYFNMPSIVYKNACAKNKLGSVSFQDVIDNVGQMVDRLDGRLVSMVSSIHESSDPTLECPLVKTYVDAIGSCLSGCLTWFLESAR